MLRRKRTQGEEPVPPRAISRRRFLKAAGAIGAGLVVVCAGGGAVGVGYLRRNIGSMVPQPTSDPNAWLRIAPDGRVRLLVNKMEMGQGIATACAQIVADELDVLLEQIDVDTATTDELPDDSFGTAGSTSVMSLYPSLRQAAAEARMTLVKLAQERDGGTERRWRTEAGRVIAEDDLDTSYGYGDLVAGKQIVRVVKDAAPRPAREHTIVGQRVPRLDIPPKVDGTARYGYDIQIEGMVHGRVAKPPVVGATVASLDERAARAVPGVVDVVRDGEFVGVVASTPLAATAALDALRVEWRMPDTVLQQDDIDAILAALGDDATTLHDVGDARRALGGATRRVSAEYRTGFATQAPIEPQVGVADVRADGATVWAPTQAPFSLRDQIAEITGLRAERVRVVPTLLGGGFGRKSVSDAAHEAARLSRAVGKPVRVAWDRGEEFNHGFMRPPTATHFEAALDDAGNIVAWQQHLATGFVLFTFFPSFLRALFGSDFGATRGAVGPYALPNHHVAATITELPVKTGSWRGLGVGPNAFAVEQWMDELAVAAGVDPLAFRLRHLPADERGQRMRRVLQTAAKEAGWGTPLPPNHGRGIACGEDAGTFVAEVAEVEVDRATGVVAVRRVVAAIDCGLAINPDGVEAQTEGGIVMGLSAALKEEIVLRDGRWSAQTFADYPIFTIADTPTIEVTVIDNRDAPPSGVGEPPLMPAAAAVGNAIAHATGARIRTMPMTPARVLAALRG